MTSLHYLAQLFIHALQELLRPSIDGRRLSLKFVDLFTGKEASGPNPDVTTMQTLHSSTDVTE